MLPARTSHPKRVGRYRLLAPIARGGAATVFLGLAESIGGFNRVVAVKMLHGHLLDDGSGVAKVEFLEEAKLSARIRHPMVVPVLDVGESEDGSFLVMDYVDGASLSEALRFGGRLPPRIALRILDDVLQGLHAAHVACDERGNPLRIVHRDYSPQNVLIGVDGRSRLTDFGIARSTTRAEFTRTGLVKGKVAYMSPEQGKGQPLDCRADVWAAGVVAWEMFAGQRMYPGMEPMPMLLQITTGTPPRLATVRPDLPPEFEEAIHSALRVGLDERCPSAEEYRQRLVAAAGGPSALASHDEVGQFIAGLGIKRIEELKTIVKEAIDNPDFEVSAEASGSHERKVEAATVPDVPRPLRGSVPDQSGTFATSTSDAEIRAMGESPATRLRKFVATRRAASLGAVLVAVAATFFGVLKWSGQSSAPTASADSGTKTASASTPVSSPAPAPSSNPSPSPELNSIPNRTQNQLDVEISADRPIRELSVGRRSLVLASPKGLVTVRLSPEERAMELPVIAISDDGRRATSSLGSKVAALALKFAGKPAPRPTVPAKPTSSTAKPKQTSGLAANPY